MICDLPLSIIQTGKESNGNNQRQNFV